MAHAAYGYGGGAVWPSVAVVRKKAAITTTDTCVKGQRRIMASLGAIARLDRDRGLGLCRFGGDGRRPIATAFSSPADTVAISDSRFSIVLRLLALTEVPSARVSVFVSWLGGPVNVSVVVPLMAMDEMVGAAPALALAPVGEAAAAGRCLLARGSCGSGVPAASLAALLALASAAVFVPDSWFAATTGGMFGRT